MAGIIGYVRIGEVASGLVDREGRGGPTIKLSNTEKPRMLQRGFSCFQIRSPFSVAEAPTQGEREGVLR